MKSLHPVGIGLLSSFAVAIFSWFTFATALHDLPFSPGMQVIVDLHHPEALAIGKLTHFFQPRSRSGHLRVAIAAHFSYYLTIGAVLGAAYAVLWRDEKPNSR
jgi:hypothetical protein